MLDVEGAVGEGEGDPSLRERRRVEGGGSGDREVHAVREVRRLVEVRVEERKPKIFRCTYDPIEITIVSCNSNKKKTKPNRRRTEEIDHEVSVGAAAGRTVQQVALFPVYLFFPLA